MACHFLIKPCSGFWISLRSLPFAFKEIAVGLGVFLIGSMTPLSAQPNPGALAESAPSRVAPPNPSLASPVGFFRELLAMNVTEREEALAGRPKAQASVIRAKLAEYELLNEDEREGRLRQLELYRLLWPLMRLPVSARGERMESIPESDRTLVAKRLSEWDRLSPQQQTNALKSKTFISYFCRPETTRFGSRQTDLSKIMPPVSRQKLERDLPGWRDIKDEEQHKFIDRLDQILRLSEEERARILDSLSRTEQAQMQLTLKRFEKLTLAQREQCLEGFSKLARLTVEERRRFILDSDRWMAMSSEQRNLWIRMILQVNPPPLPPTSAGSVNR